VARRLGLIHYGVDLSLDDPIAEGAKRASSAEGRAEAQEPRRPAPLCGALALGWRR
jgi:hypothetical protein